MFGNPDQAFEYFSDSDAITGLATTAIPGKRFVKVVAGGTAQDPHYAVCAAGDRPFGISAWTVAAGEKVTALRKGVIGVVAGAAITLPAEIISGADGKAAVAGAGVRGYGTALNDAAINVDVAVALTL